MIVLLESDNTEYLRAARQTLETVTRSWGHELTERPADTFEAAITTTARDNNKVIDPVAVAALVLSIPSAALAVLDLADRIHKRHRAKQLIDQAQQLATQNVTMHLISLRHPVELAGLTPDELLDVLTDETHKPD